MNRLGVIIPARNESLTIGRMVERTRAAVPGASVVVVDDGSIDATGLIARSAGAGVIRHPCQLGYAEAVVTGLAWAARQHLDVVALLDADEQHDPDDIPKLLEVLERSEADVVVASRSRQVGQDPRSWAGRVGNALFSATVKLLTGNRIADTSSGFKVLRREAYSDLADSHFVDFHAESLIFLLAEGFRIVEHPVRMDRRVTGRSMHRWTSWFVYPAKTALMMLVNVRKRNRRSLS